MYCVTSVTKQNKGNVGYSLYTKDGNKEFLSGNDLKNKILEFSDVQKKQFYAICTPDYFELVDSAEHQRSASAFLNIDSNKDEKQNKFKFNIFKPDADVVIFEAHKKYDLADKHLQQLKEQTFKFPPHKINTAVYKYYKQLNAHYSYLSLREGLFCLKSTIETKDVNKNNFKNKA